MNKNSMVFYKSFYEALKDLPDAERLTIYDAIFSFGLDGKEVQLTGITSVVWKLIKPNIEANNRKYENGKKGGEKRQNESKRKANAKQTQSNLKANVDANVNDILLEKETKEFIVEEKSKPKKPKKETDPSIHSQTKSVFMEFYKNRKGSEYIWSAKDGKNLKTLIEKIIAKLKTYEAEFNPEKQAERIPKGLEFLLTGVEEGSWFDENFQISILNSKFNEIYAIALKNRTEKATKKTMTLDEYNEKMDRDIRGY